jgi:hypothetical protein
MNTRLHINLANARFDLIKAQLFLARVRCGDPTLPEHYTEEFATKAVLAAIDRAWEAQCMAQGVFG